MASHSALTEEGRTRIRNFQQRLISYVLVWIVIGIGVSTGAVWLKTRYGYLPLQRLYLPQYIRSSVKSLIHHTRPSRYVILVRTISHSNGEEDVVRCTDEEVSPVRDASGVVLFDPKLGPFFRLRDGIQHSYFYWGIVWRNDAEMYLWFHDHIYGGRSLAGLYWICFLPFPFTVLAGIILSAKLDVRINREYEEGQLLRGIRLLTHKEYARSNKELDGIGLPVFGSQGTRR